MSDLNLQVASWPTPADFFTRPHVQRYVDQVNAVVYRNAIECAQQHFSETARACPHCDKAPDRLFWFSISSPEAGWDDGTGRVGFLTVCTDCRRQVDFLIDDELIEMQAARWRDCRTLS